MRKLTVLLPALIGLLVVGCVSLAPSELVSDNASPEIPVNFSGDPLIPAGAPVHTMFETREVGIQDGECQVIIYYVEGAGETYTENGFGKFGKIYESFPWELFGRWLTLAETKERARQLCLLERVTEAAPPGAASDKLCDTLL